MWTNPTRTILSMRSWFHLLMTCNPWQTGIKTSLSVFQQNSRRIWGHHVIWASHIIGGGKTLGRHTSGGRKVKTRAFTQTSKRFSPLLTDKGRSRLRHFLSIILMSSQWNRDLLRWLIMGVRIKETKINGNVYDNNLWSNIFDNQSGIHTQV